jgi:hypothetical protein
MEMLANAIFPILYYVVPAYWLVLVCFAFVTEFVVFYAFQTRAAPLWYAVISDSLANLCSAVVGLAAFWFTPGLIGIIVEPRHSTTMLRSLAVAFLLSVVVEYVVIIAFPRWRKSKRSFASVAVSNVMSYSVLAFGLLLAGFTF